MIENVPVIDIAELDSPASLAAIDRACRDWGFFQVTGHGIEPALLRNIFEVSREFFAQPAEEKQRIRRDADNPWGYYDKELTKNQQDCWPSGQLRLRFEPIVRAYYANCRTLGLRLLSAMASNLGVNASYMARGFADSHTSFLRLNYYPQCTLAASAERLFGVGEHTDAGALTLLLQDDQPGLEVCRDGQWHLVEPTPGALVINVGDMIQVWSNDRYRAALHRVVTNPSGDRYSVPFFLSPSYETTYAPLPTTVTPERPARYRPIQWREFRTLRAAGDYADIGEEVQITHYRT
jgi:isopenicillin N synthase-like dioxygenase